MNVSALFWFRRDLRLSDNAGLFHALQQHKQVQPVFIFDPYILRELPPNDARVEFIHQTLSTLHQELQKLGSSLKVIHATPEEAFHQLIEEFQPTAVYCNHDYEPYASQRDAAIRAQLAKKNIPLHTFKDQVIFEKNEVVKDDGTPYTVFTPYSKKWKALVQTQHLASYPSETLLQHMAPSLYPFPALADLGFSPSGLSFPEAQTDANLIAHYHETRDYPYVQGTSRLSIHLRFGTISIRTLSRFAREHNEKFLNELIWREFYQYILWHFPQVVQAAFKPAYDLIQWRNQAADFEAWCQGRTGYPLVDAGMRELNATGWMHNRVRMVVASFLTKHLLIDWRWGEAYFAQKLLDFDLASNNGGWQWAAGCGVDAAPYFRVFNPTLQALKFDPENRYIRQWVPEFETLNYPAPIVDHSEARERCLKVYQAAVKLP